MTFTPTEEQAAIIAAARATQDNLIVKALAGAAKTSTLVLIARALASTPMLCLAFNKRIAEEMKERLPGNCEPMTLNSLGHRTWMRALNRGLKVDVKKTGDILKELINGLSQKEKSEAWENFGDIIKAVGFGKACGYMPTGKFTTARPLIGDEFFDLLDEAPSPLMGRLVREVTLISVDQALKGVIDFDDQIYMPTIFPMATFPQYPCVLIDEAQDLSPLNHATLKKLVKKRLIAVGDECQCHPPGTLITITGGYKVPIEKLIEGTEVVSYYTQKSVFKGMRTQGRRIEYIHKSEFEGRLVVVQAGIANQIKMTPNHRCLVRMKDNEGYGVYLMRRGEQCRIGVAKLHYLQGSGLAMRARQENADQAWLLQVFPTKEMACVFENAYGGFYGIPQLLFNYPTNDPQLQSNINTAWNFIGHNWDRGKTMLEEFGRKAEFPLWSKDGKNQHVGSKSFITEACNLIDGMLMCVMSKEPTKIGADKSGWWVQINISYEEYKGPVYGLTVEPTEGGRRLYVANNTVVHNSIYGFRGAHQDSMNALQQSFNMSPLVLSVSFRCPRSVVTEAKWRAPHMQYPDWAVEGQVLKRGAWAVDDLPNTATILCRNNAPLFRMAIRLLKAGRFPQVVGSNDIGAALVKVLKKFGPSSMKQTAVLDAIKAWKEDKLKKTRNERKVQDQADCLVIFAERGQTLGEALTYIEHVMQAKGPIQLMTGHKAKGLEFDDVFILDQQLIRMDEEQDRNLKYVMQTRAKRSLTYVTSDGWQGDVHDKPSLPSASSLHDADFEDAIPFG